MTKKHYRSKPNLVDQRSKVNLIFWNDFIKMSVKHDLVSFHHFVFITSDQIGICFIKSRFIASEKTFKSTIKIEKTSSLWRIFFYPAIWQSKVKQVKVGNWTDWRVFWEKVKLKKSHKNGFNDLIIKIFELKSIRFGKLRHLKRILIGLYFSKI